MKVYRSAPGLRRGEGGQRHVTVEASTPLGYRFIRSDYRNLRRHGLDAISARGAVYLTLAHTVPLIVRVGRVS